MCRTIKKTTVKAGKMILYPFKWYIKTTAKSLEFMCGKNNPNNIRFWM